jgi:lysophospholipase L1-like esterase
MTQGRSAPLGGLGLLAARLLLIAAAVLLTMAIAELTTRWLAPAGRSLMVPQRSTCLMRSSTRSKALEPSCTGELFGTRLSTNSLGMRGPELRDDGSLRILALGDSCTMGWKVGQEEAYPAALQSILDARPDGPRVQVLNAGVPGYTSHQGLAYLREVGLALDPDVVIIAFGWNDAMRMGDVVEQIETENRRMPLIRIDDWLLINSHFYSWARNELDRSRPTERRAHRVSLEQSRRNLNAMATLASERGARIIFVSFIGTKKSMDHRLAIEGAAADQKAPLITYDGELLDLVHPTADGYRWLAERIAETLDERGYLVAAGDRPPADR